jgi:dTDP-4-dehydrorhamnose 3,5-epimerase
MIAGVEVIPLEIHRDDRGWLVELQRAARLPKEMRQTNVSFSRRGVIRGLHYHERGQDDLFACVVGAARVVVLDRTTDEVFAVDVGEDNPAAIYIPGHHAHGFEALTDAFVCYHVTEEYDPTDPDEHAIPWDDERVRHLWATRSPILSERDAAS